MAFVSHVLLGLTLAISAAHAQPTDAATKHARGVLASYIAKSQAFDASLADLYSDQAHIENLRIYPNGEVRRLTIPAAQYKAMIRQVMPLAKARKDTNRYSQPHFTAQGGHIHISLTRYSELKNYESPLVLVVGPQGDGSWRILEERSESRP
jgi:hypothetical protein